MLVVVPECSGPGYLWWTALCALCPKRWCFPEGRPLYLRGVTDLVPATRWRTWAFLLYSRPPQQLSLAPPPTVTHARSGCAAHGGPQAHVYPAPGQQAREV